MTSAGSGKIWILVPDWSRVKSSEPNVGDVTRKIGPLYFNSYAILLFLFEPSHQNLPGEGFASHLLKMFPAPRSWITSPSYLTCKKWAVKCDRTSKKKYLQRPRFKLFWWLLPCKNVQCTNTNVVRNTTRKRLLCIKVRLDLTLTDFKMFMCRKKELFLTIKL